MRHGSRNERRRAILIAGPTASGKSALAARLARRLGGRVINADSMQVYRDLAVLTARPGPEETAGVPHALYGTVDGAVNFSVSLWLAAAAQEIAAADAAGERAIFVGGTGLYFKALTQGLSDIPPVPEAVRAEVRARTEGRTPEALHAELAVADPATAARLRPTDPQRVTRALEVLAATGAPLSSFQDRRLPPVLDDYVALSLAVDREALRSCIDVRVDQMMADGALDEIARLAARRLDATLPVMRAIGVPPLLAHIAERKSLQEAVAETKAATRKYIRRQETFLRHQLADFTPVPTEKADAAIRVRLQSE